VSETSEVDLASESESDVSMDMQAWRGPAADEIASVASLFWLRRTARRQTLKALAEECVRFGPSVRAKAASLRAQAVARVLDLAKGGGTQEAWLQVTRERRLNEILETTDRVLDGLPVPVSQDRGPQVQPSSLKNGVMMPYQLDGLRWLVGLIENDSSGILADDMGLGKTVQILSLLAFLSDRNENGPHLIVVPASLVAHWVIEIKRWLPHFKYFVLKGTPSQRRAIAQEMSRCANSVNVVISTYEVVILHKEFFACWSWQCLIVDEAHRVKNFKSRLSKTCRALPGRHRIMLTGTPVQNSLQELWSLLAFVAPRSFCSLDDFERWFALPAPPSVRVAQEDEDEDNGGASVDVAKLLTEDEEFLIIQRLHKVLRPFLLRRTKDLVLADLPEKREAVIWVPLSSWQLALYRSSLQKLGRNTGSAIVLARRSMNHPYLVVREAEMSEANLVRSSGKFDFLDRWLPKLLRFGHKLLIFSQWTGTLDLLAQLLHRLEIRHLRVDGNTAVEKRQATVDAFNSDPDLSVMLLSTRAGGLGLNLQAADTVVLFDSDWNPQVDFQAIDRAHRIGQTRPVLVIRLLSPTVLDHGLFERARAKVGLEQKVISAGQFNDKRQEEDSLIRSLVRDARAPSRTLRSQITQLAETNGMLARSPEELMAFEAMDTAMFGHEGVGEDVGQLLERSGRLITRNEFLDSALAVRSLVKIGKRRREFASGLQTRSRSDTVPGQRREGQATGL